MPRTISLALANLIATGRCVSHSAVDLVIANPDSSTTTSRLATQTVTVGGNTYTPSLKSNGVTQMSLTRSTDRAEFTVGNVNLAFGLAAVAAPDVLMGAKATLSRVFTDPNTGTVYQATIFKGVCVTFAVNQNEVRVGVISDVAAAGQIAGWRAMRTNCNWKKFKGPECGYVGAETDCNRLYQDSGGCSGRSNQHRFGGFIFLTPKADEQQQPDTDPNDTPGDNRGGGGWNDGRSKGGGWRNDLPIGY